MPQDEMSQADDLPLRCSIPEAARQLGISVSAVRKRIKDGSLTTEHDGKQLVVLLPRKPAPAQRYIKNKPYDGVSEQEILRLEQNSAEDTHYTLAEIEQTNARTGATPVEGQHAMNEEISRQHDPKLIAKDEQIEILQRRVEDAERERDKLEAQIRAYQRQRSIADAHVDKPHSERVINWQRIRLLTSQTFIALVLGLIILTAADYLIVGDAIPLLPDSITASITSTGGIDEPTGATSPSSTGMNAPVGVVSEKEALSLSSTPTTVLPSTASSPTIVAPTPTTSVASVAFAAPAGGWPERDAGTWRAATVDGRYQMVLDGQTNATISTDLPNGDYQFSVDVTVVRGGAGVVFLAENPETSYSLVISTDGRYMLQTINQTNQATTLFDWTESAALRRGASAMNQLRVERRGNTISFFVNDSPLTTYAISGQFANRYGFTVISQSGSGEATFANLQGTYFPVVR